MADVRTNRPAQHVLAKENHPAQALFAQTSPESVQVSIEIGRMRRQANRFDSGVPENSAKTFTELGDPIHEEIALPQQEAVVGSADRHSFHSPTPSCAGIGSWSLESRAAAWDLVSAAKVLKSWLRAPCSARW
jgi:hypothetical protein